MEAAFQDIVDPKIEGFLESIRNMTRHSIEFVRAETADAPYQWPVTGENGEHYGMLGVTTDEEISDDHRQLYVRLSQLIGNQIDLRQQNLSLENRFRLLDAQNAELAAINRALSDIAYRDPLTGLYRRWYLMEQFRLELNRAARYGHPFSIMLIDLDHFKNVNDTCGHAAGDAVLKAFAQILTQSCRTTDVLARFGGDEFCVVLTDTPRSGAEEVAERIRAKCASHLFDYGEQLIRVTASIGVGSYGKEQRDTLSADLILDEIDQAMYRAKRRGRNSVHFVKAVDILSLV